MMLMRLGDPASAPWCLAHSLILGAVLVAIEVPETASKSGDTATAEFLFAGMVSGAAGFNSGVWAGLGGDSGSEAGSLGVLPFLQGTNSRSDSSTCSQQQPSWANLHAQ